jgi:hypothetical protein
MKTRDLPEAGASYSSSIPVSAQPYSQYGTSRHGTESTKNSSITPGLLTIDGPDGTVHTIPFGASMNVGSGVIATLDRSATDPRSYTCEVSVTFID